MAAKASVPLSERPVWDFDDLDEDEFEGQEDFNDDEVFEDLDASDDDEEGSEDEEYED
jgi:hypothetical protein